MLATPCSAPFLGSAISFALIQDFTTIFTIFFFIGIGFSAPYIILFFAPKLVYLLPKPGNWMIKIKQIFGLLMVITWLWLIYVLANNIGITSAAILALVSATLPFCLKIKNKFFKIVSIILLITLAASLSNKSLFNKNVSVKKSQELWQKFDESEIYKQVKLGKVVLVDVTADWCITCKFNKVRVLQDKEIVSILASGDVVGIRGDITKPDMEIMKFMRKHNRFAIPFNIVYGPNAPNGILTSELLNKDDLLKLINQAK